MYGGGKGVVKARRRIYGVVLGMNGGNIWLYGEIGGKNPLSPENMYIKPKLQDDNVILRRRRCHHRLRRQKLCRGPLRGPRGSPGKPPERGKCIYPLCVSDVGAQTRAPPFVVVCWGPLRGSPLCTVWQGCPNPGSPLCIDVGGAGTPAPPL